MINIDKVKEENIKVLLHMVLSIMTEEQLQQLEKMMTELEVQ